MSASSARRGSGAVVRVQVFCGPSSRSSPHPPFRIPGTSTGPGPNLFGLEKDFVRVDDLPANVDQLAVLCAGEHAQPEEGVWLVDAQPSHDDALALLDDLAVFQRLLEGGDFGGQFLRLFEAGQRHQDGSPQVRFVNGLEQVAHHVRGGGSAADQVLLAETRHQQHGDRRAPG